MCIKFISYFVFINLLLMSDIFYVNFSPELVLRLTMVSNDIIFPISRLPAKYVCNLTNCSLYGA